MVSLLYGHHLHKSDYMLYLYPTKPVELVLWILSRALSIESVYGYPVATPHYAVYGVHNL